MTAVSIILGLALLFLGGELVVRGAVLTSVRMRISPLMIGLTVVGFGTSMPELATSLESALIGSPGIAVGNIVGSNLANALLVLGLCALIRPFNSPVHRVLRDGMLMLAAALAVIGLAFGGTLGRVDGALLTIGLALFIWLLQRDERAPSLADTIEPINPAPSGMSPVLAEVAMLLGGITIIIAGGYLLVSGSIDLATALGVSETVIGLTIVAIGTSLPELATSLVAALRRQPDICYGNIVGSNIFNLLGIGGITALTTPVQVPHGMLTFDLPMMIIACLLMSFFAWTGARMTRLEGAILLTGYCVYISVTVT